MHVDMDCFFASVSVRNRPELQGIPLAVAHSNHTAGHSELSCVNYVARQAGVRADMWMAGARDKCGPQLSDLDPLCAVGFVDSSHNHQLCSGTCAGTWACLASEPHELFFYPWVYGGCVPWPMLTASHAACRCPDLVVIPYEFEAYQEVSEKVYSILLQHTDIVQPLSCDEAYLDVSGCADPHALAQQIRQEISLTGCTASIGIGPSLLVARIATKKAKPDGLFRIMQEV